LLRRKAPELAWGLFAAGNLVAMIVWESWETIPFHFIWVSLTLIYGVRVWRLRPTVWLLVGIQCVTGALILHDIGAGSQEWGELTEVPLMSAMFLAMVWHARRRQEALGVAERLAADRATLLLQQERFLHDASHELRTPVTIARGHLELLPRSAELDVAIDELCRIERIIDRLLLLAKAGRDGFVELEAIELEPFLEDVFMRWSEVAPRAWRLGPLVPGTLVADPETLRIAVDALLENAVKYTDEYAPIEVSSRAGGHVVEISVADEGPGIPAPALDRIFDRFGRADAARNRDHGGVGLGLAIVDAIARGHGGSCAVETAPGRTVFRLRFPRFTAAANPDYLAPNQPIWGALLEERT
jgi:signal transduction histidine kinase